MESIQKNSPQPLSNIIYKELEEYVKKYTCVIKTIHKKDVIENCEIIYHKGDQKSGIGSFIKFLNYQKDQYILLTCNKVLNEDDIKHGSFEIKYGDQEFKEFQIGNRLVISEEAGIGDNLLPEFTAIEIYPSDEYKNFLEIDEDYKYKEGNENEISGLPDRKSVV